MMASPTGSESAKRQTSTVGRADGRCLGRRRRAGACRTALSSPSQLGASAGGVEAIMRFFSGMPPDSGAPSVG
jgi:chemotaxis response regulator CheB